MKLFHVASQIYFEAEILEIEEDDYERIRQSKQFDFDWSLEKAHHVFKITSSELEDTQQILGLISLVNKAEELRIHINLIENAKHNKGKAKEIDNIAGCLIAFAAQVSFEKGYLGFISLVPKTALIDFYVEKYKFTRYGRQLAMEGNASIRLIQKYL